MLSNQEQEHIAQIGAPSSSCMGRFADIFRLEEACYTFLVLGSLVAVYAKTDHARSGFHDFSRFYPLKPEPVKERAGRLLWSIQ